jgi:isoleucyl-tRNA synthetase
MIGVATKGDAPYRQVVTNGWMLDEKGKAMHKSAGNAVSPNEVVKQSGAEILRLWSASTDYTEDVRCSPEILQRVADGYRKLRNTARFALGNLDGFEPSRDEVAEAELLEIDRWALAELSDVIEKVRAAYEAYEFHTVYHTLYNFCTVTLSARYFDIIKDRLYTAAPRSLARRSAQTALYRVADALARALATILVFTADEIWENLPRGGAGDTERPASVHMAQLPAASVERDAEMASRWERLFEVRDQVLRALEEARIAKIIGSSLEARVSIKARGETHKLLERYADELRYIFIVSQVSVTRAEGEAAGDAHVDVKVDRAEGEKCERCWSYSVRVGESERYPTACERCVAALSEIERGAAA